jgi:hypothetical protein
MNGFMYYLISFECLRTTVWSVFLFICLITPMLSLEYYTPDLCFRSTENSTIPGVNIVYPFCSYISVYTAADRPAVASLGFNYLNKALSIEVSYCTSTRNIGNPFICGVNTYYYNISYSYSNSMLVGGSSNANLYTASLYFTGYPNLPVQEFNFNRLSIQTPTFSVGFNSTLLCGFLDNSAISSYINTLISCANIGMCSVTHVPLNYQVLLGPDYNIISVFQDCFSEIDIGCSSTCITNGLTPYNFDNIKFVEENVFCFAASVEGYYLTESCNCLLSVPNSAIVLPESSNQPVSDTTYIIFGSLLLTFMVVIVIILLYLVLK